MEPSTLEIAEDYRILHRVARSQQELGDRADAANNYQKALDSCPVNDEPEIIREKAAIIHNFATLKANQGDIEGALNLYEQSMRLNEQIGNVQGKAATLAMMSQLLAAGGKFETAIAYLQESIAILKRIGSPDAQTVERILARIVQMQNQR